MAESFDPLDSVEPLELTVRDYVQAGWTVTSRTPNAVALEKDTQHVRISLDAEQTVHIDGPALSPLTLTGRSRAWLGLLLFLVVGFAVAFALGVFRR